MIILVPVNGESGYRSYARSVPEIVDDMGKERRKLESGQSRVLKRYVQYWWWRLYRGFGLKSNGRSGIVRLGKQVSPWKDRMYKALRS
jgi:hypothetical protein